jgi:hypothetical protein
LPDAKISFDVAYAPYGGQYIDTMEVLASTDCGATFTLLYKKGGEDLATADYNQSYFIPADDEWRTDSASLNAFIGNPEVVIAFRNIGYYGNVLYVDNINLSSSISTAVNDIAENFSSNILPNPNDGRFYLETNSFSGKEMKVTIQNEIGLILQSFSISSNGDSRKEFNLQDFGKGVYWMKIEMGDQVQVKKIVVE